MMVMSTCELCGREVRGALRTVRVEQTAMRVCHHCARYGVKVPQIRVGQKRSCKPIMPLGVAVKNQALGGKVEVVDDYALRIKKAREEYGLTQELLARRINEKLSVIKRIEAGKLTPPLEVARKLEKALKVTLIKPVEDGTEKAWGFRKLELTFGDIVEVKN
ncbi:MAG: multiprotein bridging factor aMBF1 [Candidatus Nezhaarchaeales archaeon]